MIKRFLSIAIGEYTKDNNTDKERASDTSTSCPQIQNYDDQTSTVDIIYNELFFYTLFATFYQSYLPDIINNSIGQEYSAINIPTAKLLLSTHDLDTQRDLTLISQTTTMTINELLRLQYSFPIHVGFLLYQEDLYSLRKRISNIYLPLHQLHYKLEHVQSKD